MRAIAHLRVQSLVALGMLLAAMALQRPALAQSSTWTAAAGTSLPWSGTSNWRNGTVADGAGNTATFTNSGTTTLDSNRTLGTISATGSGVRVIDGTGTLTLATPSGTPQLGYTAGTGTLAIAAVLAGTQGFQKTGSTSTLAFYGANTFTGTAVIQTGTLAVLNINALGASGNGNETVVASGAQLRILTSGTISESFILSGRGNPSNTATNGGGAIRAGGSIVTLTGNITLSGSSVEVFPDSTSSLTLAGTTSGTAGFILRPGSGNGINVPGNLAHSSWVNRWSGGTGLVTLSGSNSYAGSTSVDSGPMTLGSAYALPVTTNLSVTGATGLLNLNGNDITIRSFGWRDDSTSPTSTSNAGNSEGGTITDNSASPGTTTITVTSGSFQLGTAINDGSSGRKVALRIAGANLSTIRLENQFSNFSGGLTLLTGSGNGTRLRVEAPIVNSTNTAGALTASVLGTGTVTVGLAATDKAQFYMGEGTYTDGVGGSTVLNDFVFNTAAGTDAAGGVLLNATETTFAGQIVADQASASFATGAIVTNSVAVLTGRVTSTGVGGGLRLVGNGQVPGITVRLANQTGTANDYQGTTSVEANTTLALGAAEQVPNGAGKGNVSVVGTVNLGGFNETINGLTGSGVVDGGSGTPTLTVGDGDATSSFSGVIRNTAGSLALVKVGSGVQTLTGNSTYAGSTTVSAGTLVVNGNHSSATGAVTVAAGATLAGTGTVGGATTIGSGATLAPGASPGTLSFTQGLTWASGGNYNWQMLNASGTVGTAGGWDLVSVTGTLSIGSTVNDPFKVNLWSLSSTGPDVNGNALNFNPATSGTWRIATAAGGITGFSADKFQIVTGASNGTGGFTNALGIGTFSLAQAGNDLNLVFTTGVPTTIVINVPSGSETQAQAGHALLSGSTPVEKTGAGTAVFNQSNTLTGPTTVSEGTLQLAVADALGSSAVTLAAGATLSVGPQVQAVVPSLTNNGQVDLGLGRLTVATGQTAEGLVAQIMDGIVMGGTTGITSTEAAATGGAFTVGWVDNFDGSYTASYAAAGDTNLDNVVDLTDLLNTVGSGFYDTGNQANWAAGDFNYDGVSDLTDLLSLVGGGLYDQGDYNPASLNPLLSLSGGGIGGVAAVPEPSTCGLAALAGGLLLLAMRRNHG